MYTPKVLMAAISASALIASPGHAENSISWEANNYTEDDDRIKVRGGALTVKQDFGTDYELTAGIDYDTVSGATPMWVPIAGYSDQFEKGKVELATESRNASFGSLLVRDHKRNEYTIGLAYSEEPDYIARTASMSALLWHDSSHNRSYSVGVSHSRNTAQSNLGTTHRGDEDSRYDYGELGINQVINTKTTLSSSVFIGKETGYLSNQYLRIVRTDEFGNQALSADSRPIERKSSGLTLRGIHAFSSHFTAQIWYRYYTDDWDISGHTVEARAYWTLNSHIRLNPVARIGKQTAADFYRDYSSTPNVFTTTGFGSNDERLGEFDTDTLQMNIEWLVSKQMTFNIGFTEYSQSNGFEATWYSGGFVFKY